ncbi:ubiquitin carboxyl-terminal hydrolase MINDY-2 isoform X2 [Sceloporus undulatus]|uniref:ubiquitin carboxyl-terminal hydrolase MINDY-2 isoform X2 n=1 Tax=Sceloporus undulatus TaxID=8520 RepID=UPI001C4D05AB|nr:ubiquitin carboxyl-terminal hydrolase MINDY-2 isoform X2 [Sceloporus undulatus]
MEGLAEAPPLPSSAFEGGSVAAEVVALGFPQEEDGVAPEAEKSGGTEEEEEEEEDSLGSFSNLLHSSASSSSSGGNAGEGAGEPCAVVVAGEEEEEAPSPARPPPGPSAAGSPSPPPPSPSRCSSSAAKERFPGQSVYHLKWVRWKEENTPVVTQNENGPCPLLAIMNVLLLAWKVKLPPMMEIITAEQLMEYLGDYILDSKPKEISEIQRLNYEQNMSDAMAILHKLQTGLDVNVKFTGVRVFEYTPECIVFDLLDIPLYHGWLVDPQIADIVKAVGNCSYNQLVEKIICCKQSDNSELVEEGSVAEQFLNNTATQLTYHGLWSALPSGDRPGFPYRR